MNNVNLWDLSPNLARYESNLEAIIETIKKEKINYIKVIDKNGMQDGMEASFFTSKLNEKAALGKKKITYVDEAHSFMIDNFENVYFEKNFFKLNKDILLKNICDNLVGKEFVYISKYMYSEELAIKLSEFAKGITFDDGITLPDKIIQLYKKLRIDSYCYINGTRTKVSNSKVLGYEYDEVVSKDISDLRICSNITDLENLKYIPQNKTIYIYNNNSNYDSELFEDYDGYYNIVSKLRENGQNNKVVITVKNRELFSKSKLYNSNYDVEIDGIDLNRYKLKDLKSEDELLDLMVADIKDSNFSPFEKYIAVYNIVKKFKKYLENEKDKEESRRISKFLNNEYMVCVGYAKLLIELLNRVGINAYDYSISIDTSYDKGFTLEETPVSMSGHARVIVDITDYKYGIAGYYVSDPTWDNNLTEDYYNHALMTFDKTTTGYRYVRLDSIDLILNSRDIEDYNKRINFLIDRKKNDSFISYKTDNDKELSATGSVVSEIKNLLIKLYPEKYLELVSKYPKLKENNNLDIMYEFIYDSGKFFMSKKGGEVKLETIIDAACNVNKEVFGLDDEKKDKLKKKLLDTNLKMEKNAFPYYLKEDNKFGFKL